MFLMGSDNSKIIRIEAGELGQFPGECARNTVRVKGVVNETRIDEEFLQNWEQKVAANGGEKHGETAGGCSTEKTAQGETANTTEGRIADFRQKIEERNQTEGKNYLSFYFVTAQEYEIIAAE